MDGSEFVPVIIAMATLIAPMYAILIRHESRLAKIEGKVDVIARWVDGKGKAQDSEG